MAHTTMISDRRITEQRQPDPLKEIAGRLQKLSYRDMQKLAETFDARNDPNRSTAERLLAVADTILGETDPNVVAKAC